MDVTSFSVSIAVSFDEPPPSGYSSEGRIAYTREA
jgi:hypothetical protein